MKSKSETFEMMNLNNDHSKLIHMVIRIFRRLFIGVCLVTIGIAVYCCTHISEDLVVTNYTIQTNLKERIRIVHLTDLHNREFGQNNSRLIELVNQQEPDAIVMTGDMINKNDLNLDIACELVNQLSKISDVYYGLGNHETTWIAQNGDTLITRLTNAGAVVLDNKYLDVTIHNNNIRLAGYMGFYGAAHMTAHTEEDQLLQRSFMEEFEHTDRYKILLDHIPTSWVDWDYIDKYPVNLVLSGHYHGGIIQFPLFHRGLYVPYTGFLPKNTNGVFSGTKSVCVLSAGLGSEYPIPRINNPPEVVVVDLVPEKPAEK